MSKPVHVSDTEFETRILSSELPLIVDFWAPWCGPCKMLAPVLDRIAEEYDGRLLVIEVNTDENQEWAMHYSVQGIPTLLFIENGEVFDRQVGAAPQPVIKAKVGALLKAAPIIQDR